MKKILRCQFHPTIYSDNFSKKKLRHYAIKFHSIIKSFHKDITYFQLTVSLRVVLLQLSTDTGQHMEVKRSLCRAGQPTYHPYETASPTHLTDTWTCEFVSI